MQQIDKTITSIQPDNLSTQRLRGEGHVFVYQGHVHQTAAASTGPSRGEGSLMEGGVYRRVESKGGWSLREGGV